MRTATCTALDHVEVVRISARGFSQHDGAVPRGSRRNSKPSNKNARSMNRDRSPWCPALPLDSFLAQGLMEAQSLLLLDLDSCTRCDACVRACADAHDGVTRLVREGLRFDKYLVATSCRQCLRSAVHGGMPGGLDPPPQFAGSDHRGLVHRLRPVRRKLPVRKYQHASVSMCSTDVAEQPETKVAMVKQKATSCDLCSEFAEPSCVYACPHDAAHRVDPRQFFASLLQQNSGDIPKG